MMYVWLVVCGVMVTPIIYLTVISEPAPIYNAVVIDKALLSGSTVCIVDIGGERFFAYTYGYMDCKYMIGDIITVRIINNDVTNIIEK